MPDTARTTSALQALAADNTSGAITAQVLRDFIVSVWNNVDTPDLHQILHGAGAPSGGTGANGDYYLDTTAHALYGPKSAGSWGSGVSLIGPAGSDGADGANGADG